MSRSRSSRGNPTRTGGTSRGASPRSHDVRRGKGPRQMELIASVSRSSGLQEDGDALKDHEIQTQFRTYVQEKVNEFWKTYPTVQHPCIAGAKADAGAARRVNAQENILILFRKLREGLISSDRKDSFTVEVYETSLYLSIIFSSKQHVSSTISQLTPSLYEAACVKPISHPLPSTILILLHHLLVAYPSQTSFYDRLRYLPASYLPDSSPARIWLKSIARALRTLNYTQLEILSQPHSSAPIFPPSPSQPEGVERRQDTNLAVGALHTLLAALRAGARTRTWAVIRSAYRELWCDGGSETNAWLGNCLCLCQGEKEKDDKEAVEKWLLAKESDGEIVRKEGAKGKWVICRVK